MADEDIRITADTGQAQGALGKLGKVGEETGEKLGNIPEQANKGGALDGTLEKFAALGGRIFAATKIINAATEAVKEVAIATGNYNGETKELIDNTVALGQSISHLDLAGAARALGQLSGAAYAAATGLAKTTTELGNLSDAAAASAFANIIKAQRDLVSAYEAQVDALDKKSAALVREIQVQQEAGEVQKFAKDKVQEYVLAYEEAGKAVPRELANIAAGLDVLSKKQQQARDEAIKFQEEHAEATIKIRESFEATAASLSERTKATLSAIESVERDGKVSVEVKARISKALAELAQAYRESGIVIDAQLQSQIDKYHALATAAEDALRAKLAEQTQGAPLEGDPAVAAIQEQIKQTTAEVKRLESQDVFGVEQQNQIDAAKNKLADLNLELSRVSQSAVYASENFLTEAEAAAAAATAWDLVVQEGAKLDALYGDLLGSQEKLTEESQGAKTVWDESTRTLKNVGDEYTKVAEATDELTDSNKALKDGAPEQPLEQMKANAKEANAELEKMIGLLEKAKALSAEVSL